MKTEEKTVCSFSSKDECQCFPLQRQIVLLAAHKVITFINFNYNALITTTKSFTTHAHDACDQNLIDPAFQPSPPSPATWTHFRHSRRLNYNRHSI